MVRLLGWKVLDVPGVEADDVIGTLARAWPRSRASRCIISSGDKDLSQLVDEHITVIDTMNDRRRDLAGVEAEFGVPPRLMVDYQTLVGDAVDNVPGVPKVGPKTAVKWLLEYGSLDALVARAGEIKGVVGENLRQSLDWLPKGRELLTIKTDCDLQDYIEGLPALESIAIGGQETEALKAFYEKYGFKGLVRSRWSQHDMPPELPVGPEGQPRPEPKARRTMARAGLFDEPGLTRPPAAERATNLRYDTILTWDAVRHLAGHN